MRKTATVVLSVFLAFGGVAAAHAQTPSATPAATANPDVYGIYPIAYKEILQRYMRRRLVDPNSAVFEFSEPKAGEYKTQKGERYVGYVVEFTVKARNQFGTSTRQKYRAVIKNGEVLWAGRATQ